MCTYDNLPDPRLNQAEVARLRELQRLLDQSASHYQIRAHPEAILSAQDGVRHGIGQLAEVAPTLLLATENGYIVAIISGATRLAYKKIKKMFGLKNVALAQAVVVKQLTGSEIGTVSLINPQFLTIIDQQLTQLAHVYGGCGIPYHTLQISVPDLIRITAAKVFDFTEPKIMNRLS
jgi:prolyl-tRNA editing enzyme YbaK/EbsC (Cys-tRNA(Pro) deacylase)